MTKRLEEVFNLPSLNEQKVVQKISEDINEIAKYTNDEMRKMMEQADKIDAALPQVSGLDTLDVDYDNYASIAIQAFEDLVALGKNVEDRHAANIFLAASNMMGNALTAKTNKAQKKLDMVKLQIQKARLAHEEEKLEYLKKRHLDSVPGEGTQETEGQIIGTRNAMLDGIIAGIKKDGIV
jgi:bacterioferritin (cytochrome b1)